MPSLEDVTEFIYSNFNKITTSKGGCHFHARCPLCGDSNKSMSKKRFHLEYKDYNSIIYSCFNCGASGGFYKIYGIINGITSEEAYRHFNRYDSNRYKKILNRNKQIYQPLKETTNIHNFNYILKDCLSLDDNPDGLVQTQYQKILKKFVNDRKVNQKLYIAYDGYYKNRIIVPIWDGDDIVYFQGRKIQEQMEPKYLNPSVKKSHIIMNKNNFNKDKYIIVTEGILDADTIKNKQGTTIIGKELSSTFLNTIMKYTNKGAILVMDNDVDGQKKLFSSINKFKRFKPPHIEYFVMPRKYNNIKDLNDLTINNYINTTNMYDFIINNKYSYIDSKYRMVTQK